MIFDQLKSPRYFVTIDLYSGFFHIRIHPDDVEKLTFTTDSGHYEYLRLPFGVINGPSSFQREIDKALLGLIGYGLFVFIDDVIIYSFTLEELKRLYLQVTERLRKYNFKMQIDKCEFLKRRVSYLGHIISENGLEACPKKIEAVQKFPTPLNQKNVREFLGLSVYYSKFIKDAKISKPITILLQKDIEFQCAKSNALKNALCTAPVLIFPDFSQPFMITTDASGVALGAILSQGKIGEDRPISYASRMLGGAELRYDIYELEALAMVFGIKHFRHYIVGSHFTIVTDHKPLLWFKTADASTRVLKWRFVLSE